MSEVTVASRPPICAAMFPQKFSAATTPTTPVEAADAGAATGSPGTASAAAATSPAAASASPVTFMSPQHAVSAS